MSVFKDLSTLPSFRNAAITIGFFDGVHLGHLAIIKQLTLAAKENDAESVLITFHPHPRKLLYPDEPFSLLTPLNEKLQLLIAAGVDHVVVVPFTKEFSEMPAVEYVGEFLIKNFQPKTIVIGYDHRFGHDRRGSIDLLEDMKQQYNYKVEMIPPQLINEAAISSSKIRKALNDGKPGIANDMLGRHYTLSGTIVEGKQLGRTLGYPTANLMLKDEEQLVPKKGIYAVRVERGGKSYNGVCSIGNNPTVTDSDKLHIETHLFDMSEDMYGEEMTISFFEHLRNEEKFDSLEALRTQMRYDEEAARRTLAVV